MSRSGEYETLTGTSALRRSCIAMCRSLPMYACVHACIHVGRWVGMHVYVRASRAHTHTDTLTRTREQHVWCNPVHRKYLEPQVDLGRGLSGRRRL